MMVADVVNISKVIVSLCNDLTASHETTLNTIYIDICIFIPYNHIRHMSTF